MKNPLESISGSGDSKLPRYLVELDKLLYNSTFDFGSKGEIFRHKMKISNYVYELVCELTGQSRYHPSQIVDREKDKPIKWDKSYD